MLMLFEFTGDTWALKQSWTFLSCAEAPAEAWRDWAMPCDFDDVECRGGDSRVTVIQGFLDCADALDIADRYLAGVDAGEAQGQGLFWNSGEWQCFWPYLEGRPHSESPLSCVRSSDKSQIYIGDFQVHRRPRCTASEPSASPCSGADRG
jgi:hypothetical protein